MKNAALAAMLIVAAAPQVFAGHRAPAPRRTVMVCIEMPIGGMRLGESEAVASGIFARIGIRIVWRPLSHCPEGAVQVSFQIHSARDSHPGALAYALPFEGTHIVVLLDRVEALVSSEYVTVVMAHVLAHEITHILQGVTRHSDFGLMKAHWDPIDYCKMYGHPLGFTRDDVELIYLGLDRRDRLAALAAQHGDAGLN